MGQALRLLDTHRNLVCQFIGVGYLRKSNVCFNDASTKFRWSWAPLKFRFMGNFIFNAVERAHIKNNVEWQEYAHQGTTEFYHKSDRLPAISDQTKKKNMWTNELKAMCSSKCHWLVDWFIDWLTDWLIDWLIDGWMDGLVEEKVAQVLPPGGITW